MSNEEQADLIQTSDERHNTHTLGIALQLRYNNESSTTNYTNNRLVLKLIDVCSPVFDNVDSNINIGLYRDHVFVSMDEDFVFWTSIDLLIPSGFTEQEFADYLRSRRELAIGEIETMYIKMLLPKRLCHTY